MEILDTIATYIFDFEWRDIVEISFFSLIVYGIQLWLCQDNQKPLLGYWYGYCGMWVVAYFLNFSTIACALCMFLPAAITIFVLIHQRTLQKNYVMLQSITSLQINNDDWLDQVMKTALSIINSNKPFWCIIEHKDSLKTMVKTDLVVDATVTKAMLSLLLENITLSHKKCLWITTQGTICGINATWSCPADAIFVDTIGLEWQQDAIFFTGLTDALMLYVDPCKRTCTIAAEGRIVENITAQEAYSYIKKHQRKPNVSKKKERFMHGSYSLRTGSSEQTIS